MSLSRQAILIGAPNVKPILPGVLVDLNDIKNYLLSGEGGAWRENEIITLIDPSPSEVLKYITASKNKDYVFITCSGHGEHRIGNKLDETVMYLNDKETISINNLNPQNKRQLVIVDVCRHLVKVEKLSKEHRILAMFENENISNIDYRKIFDEAIMSTSEGRIVAYSCDLNQSAGDDGSGGVFTQAMLKAPSKFNLTNGKYGIVDINQAFDTAKKMTFNENAPQSAVLIAGRRQDFFPFAIIIK